MAAGDLLSADHQFEIRTTLYGRGTAVHIDSPHIGGLGIPPTKTADFELDGQDGSVGSGDYNGVRIVSIPVTILGAGETECMTTLRGMLTTWAVSAVDIPLHLRLPGYGHCSVNGKPRGLEPDLSTAKSGWIDALLRFDALDPTITFY